MSKLIATQFFDNKSDQIPRNANVLVKRNPTPTDVEPWLENQAEQIAFWMVQHPEGKVELTWV